MLSFLPGNKPKSVGWDKLTEKLIESETDIKTDIKEESLNIFDICYRCEIQSGQSWMGISLYVITVCLNFVIGYSIYRAQDIYQKELSNTELFGDITLIGFMTFSIISFPWHQWAKLTCLHKTGIEFWKGLGRYLIFVLSCIGSTAIYGAIRNIPLFQSSLNSELSNDQLLIYIAVFIVIGIIVIYWCLKLFNFECTRRCCRPSYSNRLAFIRIAIGITIVNVGAYFACKSDNCDYHIHHWTIGLCLVLMSTPLIDNWFDFSLQGIFWMFVIESVWNYEIKMDEFFI